MNLIYFIILLSVIVIIHEAGHLIAAKIFKVYCPEFSIGMGPKLFGKKFGETTYNVRLFPIGGFVSMAGDTENALETTASTKEIPFERTILGIANWKKIIIMLAGVFMNFVLALLIVAAIFLNQGAYVEDAPAVVGGVIADSPAESAGLQAGDVITKVVFADGTTVSNPDTFMDILVYSSTNTDVIEYTIERDGETKTVSVTPYFDEDSNTYIVGIQIPQGELITVTAFNTLQVSADYLYKTTKLILSSLGQLIQGRGLQNLSGPVGIYNVSSEAASQGIETFLLLIALISLNIGVFNLLPLPVLDGGRVLLTLIEMIIRKPLNQKIQNAIMSFSIFLLLLLMVFATYQDIAKLF